MLIKQDQTVSIRRKCELLGVNRSGLYCKRTNSVTTTDVSIMNQIRDIYLRFPFFGYRKVHAVLQRNGYTHNRKKTQRLMRLAGLKAICPYKKKKRPAKAAHKIYPYLLGDVTINRPNQIWQVDITYIKIRGGFVYLVCLIDVYSRKIMGWNLSIFLDTSSCIEALTKALVIATPEIVNSDQGCQFTSATWCNTLLSAKIRISMDGKGRWADNIYVERLWRSIKYELIYLHRFETVDQVKRAIANYIDFYNSLRPHQSLEYKCPDQIYKEFKNVENNTNLEALQLSPFREKEALLNF